MGYIVIFVYYVFNGIIDDFLILNYYFDIFYVVCNIKYYFYLRLCFKRNFEDF